MFLCDICAQTFLTSKWRRYSNIFCTSNSICNVKYKCMFLEANKYITFIYIYLYIYNIYIRYNMCLKNQIVNNIKISKISWETSKTYVQSKST